MRSILIALGAIALLFFGCTTSEPEVKDPMQARLEKKMAEAATSLASFDEKIKEAKNDHGLRDHLLEERELLKSRLERLKERYKSEGGTLSEVAPPAAGGGGHH